MNHIMTEHEKDVLLYIRQERIDALERILDKKDKGISSALESLRGCDDSIDDYEMINLAKEALIKAKNDE